MLNSDQHQIKKDGNQRVSVAMPDVMRISGVGDK